MNSKGSESVYTLSKTSEMLGLPVAKVREEIVNGRLKASFLANIADYVVKHEDIQQYLVMTRDFKTLTKVVTRRVLLVDRDSRLQDILRMELSRQGCEVKVATTDHEVHFLSRDYRPDILCLHIGSTMRSKDSIKDSIIKARDAVAPYIILYHNYLPHVMNTPDMVARIKAVNAHVCISINAGTAPLLNAIREHFGIAVQTQARKPRTA